MLHEIAPQRQLAVARELTKKFEELQRGTAAQLLKRWENEVVKGEIVLLIAPNPSDQVQDWSHLSPKEHVEWIEKTYAISRHEAIKIAAELRGVPKREIYNTVVRE